MLTLNSAISKLGYASMHSPLTFYEDRQPNLYVWACQISRASQETPTDNELWSAAGRCLIVVEPDIDELPLFLMASAGAIGAQFLSLSILQFIECAENLLEDALPSMVYIEPGAWLTQKDEDQEVKQLRANVKAVIQRLHACKSQVVVVTYASEFRSVSGEFRHEYLFDRHIFWARPRPNLIADELFQRIGKEYFQDELISQSDRLGKLLCLEFPSSRRIGMLAASLRRKAIFEARKVGWKDVIEVSANGTGEGFSSNECTDRTRIATHEAGHVVINMVDSNFLSIPDFVSLGPGNGTLGIAVESASYAYQQRWGNLTYREVCSRIRTCLGGRIAEELEYGIEGCGAYASAGDLENASQLAFEMVAQNGFPAVVSPKEPWQANLVTVSENPKPEEMQKYAADARRFLEDQYRQARSLLEEHWMLLDAVRKELLCRTYLLRDDLVGLCHSLNITIKDTALQ